MNNIIATFISWLEAGLAKLKADIEAVGSALWPLIENAFTAAEQNEINALIPIAQQALQGVNTGQNPKTIFSDALAAMETSIVSTGGTFVLTLATQALTLVIDDLMGAQGNGNQGNNQQGS